LDQTPTLSVMWCLMVMGRSAARVSETGLLPGLANKSCNRIATKPKTGLSRMRLSRTRSAPLRSRGVGD
ncbi:MAG: hypothetical protein ABFD81_05815, partial [Syntrophaceae bacterium]